MAVLEEVVFGSTLLGEAAFALCILIMVVGSVWVVGQLVYPKKK